VGFLKKGTRHSVKITAKLTSLGKGKETKIPNTWKRGLSGYFRGGEAKERKKKGSGDKREM